MKCEIFGCQIYVYRRLAIGPGTSTALCEDHYTEFKKELIPENPKQGGEDMVQDNTEKADFPKERGSAVLEVRLTGVDIPRAGVLADLLQEWVTWVKTHGALIGTDDQIVSLYQRTRDSVKKWGRDG